MRCVHDLNVLVLRWVFGVSVVPPFSCGVSVVCCVAANKARAQAAFSATQETREDMAAVRYIACVYSARLPIRYVIMAFSCARSLYPLTVRHGKHAQDVHTREGTKFHLFCAWPTACADVSIPASKSII